MVGFRESSVGRISSPASSKPEANGRWAAAPDRGNNRRSSDTSRRPAPPRPTRADSARRAVARRPELNAAIVARQERRKALEIARQNVEKYQQRLRGAELYQQGNGDRLSGQEQADFRVVSEIVDDFYYTQQEGEDYTKEEIANMLLAMDTEKLDAAYGAAPSLAKEDGYTMVEDRVEEEVPQQYEARFEANTGEFTLPETRSTKLYIAQVDTGSSQYVICNAHYERGNMSNRDMIAAVLNAEKFGHKMEGNKIYSHSNKLIGFTVDCKQFDSRFKE